MTPIGRTLRTPLAAVATAALTLTSLTAVAAGPAGALDANDLAPGSITADRTVGDFTILATAAKGVTVDASDRTSDRGDVYTQRLKLNGSGDATQRSVRLTVDEPAEVLVHARSGSGTADRALALYDADWTVLDTVPALADDTGTTIATETLDVPAAGTYWIASPSSGVNLYYAEVVDGPALERAPWADVAAPVVDAVEVDPADPSRLLVQYTGLLGDDGADVAHAILTDADGVEADRAFTAVDGTSGTVALTPPSSGTYTVRVELTRSGETTAHASAAVTAPDFALPLAGPEVTGALTTAVSGGRATVTVEWGAVAEATTYAVQTAQDGDFTDAVTDVTGTTADLTGLTPGAVYQVRVVAHRGTDATAGEPFEVVVADAVERWQSADIGSNAGSGGSIVENADGSITFDARASSTKLASSEDGFQYYYTQIDPTTENFTLTATFRVDDAATKDNQSGFGVLAVDTLVPGVSAARYMNSAGALVTRYGEGTTTVRDGTPGARFVHGYTGAPDDATAGARDTSGSVVFDETWRSDVTSGPRFATGDTFTFSLRGSNTGHHATWLRDAADGGDVEVISYDPDMLLQQDGDHIYVGMAVARKIQVTVTDWELTTVRPEDDDAPLDPPTVPVAATLGVDVTPTTPHHTLDLPFVANMHGTGQVLDAAGDIVVDDVELAPGERVLVPVDLTDGVNELTARLLPDADQPQLGDREELASTDPVDVPLTLTVHAYGEPGQSIRVTPDGTPDGTGTSADPLDLHTAVAYAQPGQQIVLAGGTYALDRKVVVGRGLDGTPDAPITLMSAPGQRATLDLAGSPDGGLVLRGDWWHVHDLEITRSRDKAKPMLVEGHHNVVERVESHHNADTGIQISGRSAEPPTMWPSHNLVVSSESHHNADPGGNDADGFGVKLTVGEGNVLRHNIAHHNIDDGWDLYAKSTTGPIGTVVVEDSVAYANGYLSEDPTRTGEGNGFKLGGESIPGDHLLRNSVSYGNLGTGVTSNSGPDVRLDGVTSVGNDRGVRLETNASTTAYEAHGVISWRNPATDVLGLKQTDTSLLTNPTNHWNLGGTSAVDASWFVSTDETVAPEIAADGSVDLHGLYELTDAAPADTGARPAPVDDPTVIELLPEVGAEPGPAPWYASTVYLRGDVVQHDGTVYEARWWSRNQEPGISAFGPWTEVGPADAAPAVAECAPAWERTRTYTGGEVVSHDGVNHRAQWWTRGDEPGTSVWGSWSAVGPCA
ncbi:fibronectin type III domain protein [Isoptericola jiangsuensis]|uniref:Fibronectin type III domain protein n=1 Tax=Isoptericola jiangsuensis TaxID=548579 RepID=A0A2A9F190_9MICO|nr:carbohydrate-binding protein [Isoptericola jiangsuensis]PFG44576.1 fibronectin type III domain protein [Isoptericola jiangsuensis]